MRRKHLVAALVLMAFGVWYGYQTSLLPTRTLPHAPSPSFFPGILTCAVRVLAVALLMMGYGMAKTLHEDFPLPDVEDRMALRYLNR